MKSKFLYQDVDVVSLADKGIVVRCFVCRNYDKVLMETGNFCDNIRVIKNGRVSGVDRMFKSSDSAFKDITDRVNPLRKSVEFDIFFLRPPSENIIVFWPNVVFISFACRARIDWCQAEFIEDMIEAMHFAVDQFFSPIQFLDDKLLTQFVIHCKSRCPHNALWNTIYYKLRWNSTPFIMYYKLRNYYKLQRNKP